MLKSYIKGTRLLFSTNFSTNSTNFYCTLNYVKLGGHILNISKTILPKLIFYLRLGYQIHNVSLQEFYTHSTYVINHCI